MNSNWINEQTEYNVAQWDTSMEDKYPEAKKWNKDAIKYYDHVCKECNFLDAVKVIDWEQYLVNNANILDLGCGGGWLSGYLSKFEEVQSIYSLDTSKNYLFNIMPGVLDIMGADASKITKIEGMFSPLLIEDNSLDLVVSSAALHHADNLQLLLDEIYKKLKPGGISVIINETPSSYYKYIARILKASISIFFNIFFKKYTLTSQKISSSSFEYDPWLGDKMYPMWYWKQAIKNSGYEINEFIDTKMSTVKGMKQESLKHFVCRKVK